MRNDLIFLLGEIQGANIYLKNRANGGHCHNLLSSKSVKQLLSKVLVAYLFRLASPLNHIKNGRICQLVMVQAPLDFFTSFEQSLLSYCVIIGRGGELNIHILVFCRLMSFATDDFIRD